MYSLNYEDPLQAGYLKWRFAVPLDAGHFTDRYDVAFLLNDFFATDLCVESKYCLRPSSFFETHFIHLSCIVSW